MHPARLVPSFAVFGFWFSQVFSCYWIDADADVDLRGVKRKKKGLVVLRFTSFLALASSDGEQTVTTPESRHVKTKHDNNSSVRRHGTVQPTGTSS